MGASWKLVGCVLAVSLLTSSSWAVVRGHSEDAAHDHGHSIHDAQHVPEPVRNLIHMIQCPVCDYSIAAVAKDVLLHELACRLWTSSTAAAHSASDEQEAAASDDSGDEMESPHEESIAVHCEEKPQEGGRRSLRVSPRYAFERVLRLCDHEAVRLFPATESLLPPDNAATRLEVEKQHHARPIEAQHWETIAMACRRGLPRREHRSIANKLTEIAWSMPLNLDGMDVNGNALTSQFRHVASGLLPSLPHDSYTALPMELRAEIYRRVVKAQQMACAICGDVERPTELQPPRAAAFSASGERIRVFEHLTFAEAERIRTGGAATGDKRGVGDSVVDEVDHGDAGDL